MEKSRENLRLEMDLENWLFYIMPPDQQQSKQLNTVIYGALTEIHSEKL
jgi:hypothetical protein